MKNLHRVGAFALTIIVLCCCCFATVAFADVSETGTSVRFRVVLNSYMRFASCSVYVTEFESMESDVAINKFDFSVGRSEMWERTLTLSPGFYQVTYISILGSWDSMLAGKTDRFEVKGEKMTVYAGLESKESPVTLPDPWLIYGEDNQQFHIWDGTPGFIIDASNTSDVTSDSSISLPELPSDISSDMDENSAPYRPNAPSHPTTSADTSEPAIAPSARIGNILFYVLVSTIIAICAVILIIKARKR